MLRAGVDEVHSLERTADGQLHFGISTACFDMADGTIDVQPGTGAGLQIGVSVVGINQRCAAGGFSGELFSKHSDVLQGADLIVANASVIVFAVQLLFADEN